jgi:hypothetical protein
VAAGPLQLGLDLSGQPADRRGRLDVTGAELAVAAFSVLTYAIIEAPSNGRLSVTTLGLFAASVALLAAFVAWEARSDHSMLSLHLFRNPRFTGAGLTITVLFFAPSGAVFLNSQIPQFVLGYSPLAAGIRALSAAAALAVFSPLGAWMAKRAGTLAPVALGLAAVTAGLALFVTASAGSGYGHYILAMVIARAGIGLAMSAATSASMAELPLAMAGVGSAVNETTRNRQRPERGRDGQHHRVGVRQPDGAPGARDHRVGGRGRGRGAPRRRNVRDGSAVRGGQRVRYRRRPGSPHRRDRDAGRRGDRVPYAGGRPEDRGARPGRRRPVSGPGRSALRRGSGSR